MRQKVADLLYRALMIGLLGLVGLTTRKRWINRHIIEALQIEGQNFLLSIWHNNLVYFIYVLGPMKLTGLASRSRDGENISWILRVFGFRPVRGSTSQGSLSALRQMLRALRAGQSAAITPDGPLGPRYVLQKGVVGLAQRSGVPIVPLTFSAPSAIEFKSWDRMKLPRPFSTVTIYVGNPIWIGREETDEEAARLRVEHAMRRAAAVVDRFAGGGLVEREPLLAEVAEPEGS